MTRTVYTLTVEIVTTSREAAEQLREEIVGAIEDNAESREIDAEGFVGPLDAGRPEAAGE